MPIYSVKPKGLGFGVVRGHNAADAALRYDRHIIGMCQQDENIRDCDDSINNYCEQLLAQYEVTEMYRGLIIESVERNLDGDNTIVILL